MIAGLILAAITAKGGDLPAWVIPTATVVAAALGAAALVIVRRMRGPVAIQDLWAENRSLRADLKGMNDRLQTTDAKVERLMRSYQHQITVNQAMGEGFDALSNYVERTSGSSPAFTQWEHDAVQRARALRSDDLIWATQQPENEGEPS